MIKKIVGSIFVAGFVFASTTHALTSPYVKEQQLGIDLYFESDALDYLPPSRFQPVDLASAPEDANHWIFNVLPYEQDRYEDIYLVIPQLWLITPVVDIPVGSYDYEQMKAGYQIGINPYLKWWIIEYVTSVSPGNWWKRVDFWHSNYYKSDNGRYKNIFANLMALDPGDQVWYYVKQSNGSYVLFKYRVDKSYNTYPGNVQALQWDGDGADALVFGCTYGLDGRWMIEASYLGEAIGMPLELRFEGKIPAHIKQPLDRALAKLRRLPPKLRKYEVIQLIKLVERLKTATRGDSLREVVLEYVELVLVDMYPE